MLEERRQLDPILIELRTRFQDFTERYERDSTQTELWRVDTTKRLKIHCDFINDVSPIYKRLCWILGVAAVASVGIAIKALWTHVHWG